MVCMGGPAWNWICKPTVRHHIDTDYTVCYTQYITPWPLTHPHCAPAFFSFSMACDRRQINEVFQKALRHLTPSKIFEFILIATVPTFLKLEQVGLLSLRSWSDIEMVHWFGFEYIITSLHNRYWDIRFHGCTKFLMFWSEDETCAQIVQQQERHM